MSESLDIAERRKLLAALGDKPERAAEREARAVLRDDRDVEEVVHSTLGKIERDLPVLDVHQPGRFFNWVKTVARNSALDVVRKQKGDPTVLDGLENEKNLEVIDGYLVDAMSRAQSVGSEVANQIVIEEAFATLDPETRAILECRLLDGLPYAEIGTRFGLDADAAESRIRRARKVLALHLFDARDDLLGRGR